MTSFNGAVTQISLDDEESRAFSSKAIGTHCSKGNVLNDVVTAVDVGIIADFVSDENVTVKSGFKQSLIINIA